MTDKRPSRGAPSHEYDASNGQRTIQIPPAASLRHLFEDIGEATDQENAAKLKKACTELLSSLSIFYGVSAPSLKLLGPRPHSTLEGRLADELFGDYSSRQARIRLWTRTPMRKHWTSSKTTLSTLCHEFMHHLDIHELGFPHSFHTIGFFERTHKLYLTVVGHPYYPLEWRSFSTSKSGKSWVIDWAATNRTKARASGQIKQKNTPMRKSM